MYAVGQLSRTHFLRILQPNRMTSPHPFDRYAAYTDLDALKAYSDKPLRKSIRVNTLKTTVAAVQAAGAERGWMMELVPWCPEAFFIDRADRSVALGKDLLHLLGHVYMQEAASMLPAELLDPRPGEVILDMSAAPGSKSTQIAARMRGRGVLVCNDVQEKRLWTLKSALHRAGVTNAIVTKKVGQWFAKHMTERFDRVLCDAPCTAQGTARKDSDALNYCSLENIGKMARLQRELLESAIDAAKIGGRIVYSTCTLTPEENEEVIRSILRKLGGKVRVVDVIASGDARFVPLASAREDSLRVQEAFGDAPSDLPLLRFWPQAYDTEGFFCAVLEKTGSTRRKEWFEAVAFQEEEVPRARSVKLGETLASQFGSPFLQEGDRLFQRGEHLLLSTEEVMKFALTTQNYSVGLPFALRLDGDRLRLDHEIASLRGNSATKNVVTIDDEQLDLFLDGKDAQGPKDVRGDVILLHRGVPVGLALAKEGHLKNRLPRWIVAKS